MVQLLPLATDTYYFVLYDPTGTYPLRLVNDGGTPVAFPAGSNGDFEQLDIDLSTGQIIADPTPAPAQLAVGGAHACVLDDAGAVGCWGLSSQGQGRPPAGASRPRSGMGEACSEGQCRPKGTP